MALMNLPILMLLKPILQHVSQLLPLPEGEKAQEFTVSSGLSKIYIWEVNTLLHRVNDCM